MNAHPPRSADLKRFGFNPEHLTSLSGARTLYEPAGQGPRRRNATHFSNNHPFSSLVGGLLDNRRSLLVRSWKTSNQPSASAPLWSGAELFRRKAVLYFSFSGGMRRNSSWSINSQLYRATFGSGSCLNNTCNFLRASTPKHAASYGRSQGREQSCATTYLPPSFSRRL